MTVSDFAEITHDVPEKSLTSAMKRSGGRNGDGHITVVTRVAAQAPLPHHRLQAEQGRRPGKVFSSSTIPTARRTSRCSTTQTARSATSSRRSAWRWATPCFGPTVDIRPGNTLPLQNIPIGT